MNNSAPRLSPLFRSDTQAEILARVILNPERGYTITELSKLTGAAYATTHREVQRLVELGLFRQQQIGRAVQVSANEKDPAFGHVEGLLRLSYGPATILPRVLAGVRGILEAYIYGSWAARRAGEPGTPPADIDVLVIGNPPRADVYDAATSAEHELGREVNIRIISPDAWAANDDLFLRTVREQPMLPLDIEEIR